jgi:hypothetical protein
MLPAIVIYLAMIAFLVFLLRLIGKWLGQWALYILAWGAWVLGRALRSLAYVWRGENGRFGERGWM